MRSLAVSLLILRWNFQHHKQLSLLHIAQALGSVQMAVFPCWKFQHGKTACNPCLKSTPSDTDFRHWFYKCSGRFRCISWCRSLHFTPFFFPHGGFEIGVRKNISLSIPLGYVHTEFFVRGLNADSVWNRRAIPNPRPIRAQKSQCAQTLSALEMHICKSRHVYK